MQVAIMYIHAKRLVSLFAMVQTAATGSHLALRDLVRELPEPINIKRIDCH